MTDGAAAPAGDTGGETGGDLGRGDVGAAPPAPDFAVPEAYADKAWAGNIKSLDDLYSQFDNAQGMIGKKVIPSADDGDDAWNEFYSQLRPETADLYELALPEGFEGEINAEVQGEFKELFHKLGFTQKQAQDLYAGYIELNGKHLGSEQTPEQIEAEFGEMMKERFADKSAEAIKIANKYMAMLPEGAAERFQTLPNDVLVDIVDSYNMFHNQFTKEDGAPDLKDSTSGSAPTREDLVKKSTELRRHEALKDPLHPDHEKVRAELKDMDDRIQRLFG